MRWTQWWAAKRLARHYAIHTPSMTSIVCQTFGYPPLVAPLGCRIPSISREGEYSTPNLFLMLPPWLQVNAASAVGALNWSPDLTLRIFIEWSVRLLKTVYPLCVGTYLAICKNYFEISCPWNQMEKTHWGLWINWYSKLIHMQFQYHSEIHQFRGLNLKIKDLKPEKQIVW